MVTRELAAFLEAAPNNTAMNGNLVNCYHKKGSTYVLNAVTAPAELAWADPSIPKPLIDEGRDRPAVVFKIAKEAPLPPTEDLPGFKSACATLGFETPHTFVVLARGTELHFYFLWEKDQSVTDCGTIPAQEFHPRLDDSHEFLRTKSVALIGCGSLGSKIAPMLARSGVARFVLIDDDLLLPDNFVRNDLDWRDVGSHKASAVARRVTLVNPNAESEIWQARLGGQEFERFRRDDVEAYRGLRLDF